MLKLLYKKVFVLALLVLSCLTFSSCDNDTSDNDTSNENIPEYYENKHGSINSSDVQPGVYLTLYTNLKVKTEKEIEKNIEVTFSTGFKGFSVDDPELEGLDTKKILELYSDLEQRLNFSITRIIYSGEKSFYYTLDHLGNIDTELSRKEVYSKEDTVSYFINDFSKDIPTDFSIDYDDFSEFSGNVFCVVYLLTITPCEGNEIRLLRPASSFDVNLSIYKGNAQSEGINAGDSINYVHFTKVLEKEILKFNYLNLKVEDGKIEPLPYVENDNIYAC